MKYYKDKQGQLYVDPIVANHTGLVEVTEAEFKVLTTPTQAELDKRTKQVRISELNMLLSDSDYKMAADYDKDVTQIKLDRQAWRDELRLLA